MPQFFVKTSHIIENNFDIIQKEDYLHLAKVRRVKNGDIISVRTDNGMALTARVKEITGSLVRCEIVEKKEQSFISPLVTLYLGILKGKNFDFAIQKAVEVGITRIVPVVSERTIPKIMEKENAKIDRWNKISLEAAKQCMRNDVPPVLEMRSFAAVLSNDNNINLIAHTAVEEKIDVFESATVKNSMGILIGPEGGFSSREIGMALEAGWKVFHFGNTQLRAETAAIVIPALVIHELMKRNPF